MYPNTIYNKDILTHFFLSQFSFNGKEKDNETYGEGNEYDFDARIYSPRLGSFLSLDPLAKKYPNLSSYVFCKDNPLVFIDKDGKDSYLVIWATSNGEVGHAAIAVDNYKKIETKVCENGLEITKVTYEKDGTVTYYDLWPGNEGGVGLTNAGKDVKALYQQFKISSVDDLLNTDPSKGEKRAPDGVVKITTSGYEADKATKQKLEEAAASNVDYNGKKNNCSDYAKKGVESSTGQQVDAAESIIGSKSTTPNKLFKETQKLPNTQVIKDPGNKVNKTFIKGIKEK